MNPRQIAIDTVRKNLGLNNTPASWSYEQRVEYNKALADYISSHPSLFTPQDLQTASTVQTAAYAPLADNSLLSDIGTFGVAFGSNVVDAVDQVGDVGRGALDGISLAGKALPLLVIVGIGLLIWVGVGKAQSLRAS